MPEHKPEPIVLTPQLQVIDAAFRATLRQFTEDAMRECGAEAGVQFIISKLIRFAIHLNAPFFPHDEQKDALMALVEGNLELQRMADFRKGGLG